MTKQKQSNKQKKPLTALTVSLYTMAAWVGLVTIWSLISLEPRLLIFAAPHLLLIYWGWSVLKGQIKSETLQQLANFICILGALSVVAMIWTTIAYQLYFQW